MIDSVVSSRAYGEAMRRIAADGEQAGAATGSFRDVLMDSLADTRKALGDAERASATALAGGQVDLGALVTAVNGAELAVETAVAVRDKVISAYQEIIRMPI